MFECQSRQAAKIKTFAFKTKYFFISSKNNNSIKIATNSSNSSNNNYSSNANHYKQQCQLGKYKKIDIHTYLQNSLKKATNINELKLSIRKYIDTYVCIYGMYLQVSTSYFNQIQLNNVCQFLRVFFIINVWFVFLFS